MTREELIDHLQHLEQYTHYSEDAPALREVIEMLTNLQPTCNELATNCISRREAIDICAHAISLWHGQLGEGALIAVRDKIKELPSAQPEPKTGRWEPVTNGRGGHWCNRCNEYAPSWMTGEEHLTNFCPNCGVDMRGGHDDQITHDKRTETHACDLIDRRDAIDTVKHAWAKGLEPTQYLEDLPSAQPEITDIQAIEQLQASGWMQNHDKQMYEMGLREQLANDNDSYDALLPSAQPDLSEYSNRLWRSAYERGKRDAQPEQQWIPCSERLPEESGRYLISVLDGVGRRTTVAPYQPRCKAWTMTGRMAYWKVIAWMPLPEPYGGE